MAGISFVLRRLTRRNDLSGAAQAFIAASAVTAGPWLMTVIAIAGTDLFSRLDYAPWEHETFRIVLSYCFCFSLVFTAPVVTIATRLVADQVFAGRVDRIGATFLHALGVAFLSQMPLVLLFWGWLIDLPPMVRLSAILCYAGLVGVWVAMTFLSVLRDFRWAVGMFAFGMLAASAVGVSVAHTLGAAGLLGAFALGAAIIMFAAANRILREFTYAPFPLREAFADAGRYWELAVVGLLAAAAPWSDKWVLWLSPFGERLSNGLMDFPAYDSAMFFSYLAMIPCMAVFFVAAETDFFLAYRRFFNDLLGGASLGVIEAKRRSLVSRLSSTGISLLVLQLLVTVICLLASPLLVAGGVLTPVQFPIFRFGLMGALFHALLNCVLVVMSYLDVRQSQIVTTAVFLVANAGFTLAFEALGYPTLGYGYLAASCLSLVLAVGIVAVKLHKLLFLVFVSNNPSVQSV